MTSFAGAGLPEAPVACSAVSGKAGFDVAIARERRCGQHQSPAIGDRQIEGLLTERICRPRIWSVFALIFGVDTPACTAIVARLAGRL